MQKTGIIISLSLAGIIGLLVPSATFAAAESASTPAAADYPVRLIIPSIALNAPIQKVGLTKSGDMAVPSGSTNNVGWYKNGTTPGQAGSAVIDAHVFAAFKGLNKLTAGADIYVEMQSGVWLHFTVAAAQTYPLASVPLNTLFNRADAPRLNLITCAGKLTQDHSTYDHRLVIYTTLA